MPATESPVKFDTAALQLGVLVRLVSLETFLAASSKAALYANPLMHTLTLGMN
jgi:hypothetical protein